MCVRVYVCVRESVFVSVCSVCVCVRERERVFVSVFLRVYVCVRECVFVSVCVCAETEAIFRTFSSGHEI